MTAAEVKLLVGRNIRELRKKKGWSQEKLGECIGRSKSSISQYECGKDDMLITILGEMAEGLGVPMTRLVREKDDKLLSVKERLIDLILETSDEKTLMICNSVLEAARGYDSNGGIHE